MSLNPRTGVKRACPGAWSSQVPVDGDERRGQHFSGVSERPQNPYSQEEGSSELGVGGGISSRQCQRGGVCCLQQLRWGEKKAPSADPGSQKGQSGCGGWWATGLGWGSPRWAQRQPGQLLQGDQPTGGHCVRRRWLREEKARPFPRERGSTRRLGLASWTDSRTPPRSRTNQTRHGPLPGPGLGCRVVVVVVMGSWESSPGSMVPPHPPSRARVSLGFSASPLCKPGAHISLGISPIISALFLFGYSFLHPILPCACGSPPPRANSTPLFHVWTPLKMPKDAPLWHPLDSQLAPAGRCHSTPWVPTTLAGSWSCSGLLALRLPPGAGTLEVKRGTDTLG